MKIRSSCSAKAATKLVVVLKSIEEDCGFLDRCEVVAKEIEMAEQDYSTEEEKDQLLRNS
jgi:hypothetical protein